MKQITIVFLFLLPVLPIAAQDTSVIISQRKYFLINYDNDFFSATDRYYTWGTRLELVLPGLRKLPLMKILLHLPSPVNEYGIAAVQDCFTPTSIRRDTILKGDRPFAAYIRLDHFRVSTDENKTQRLYSELGLGVLGPWAGGCETQQSIHRWLNNIEPLGWQFQLANDAVINYKLRYEKGLTEKKHSGIIAYSEVNAGTLYDNASLGVLMRAGKMSSYFSSRDDRSFQLYGFIRGNVRAVGYNATLQGGLFSKDIYTIGSSELGRFVFSAFPGIVLSYKKISLEYSKAFITPELKTGKDHGWGHVNVTTRF